MSVERYGSKTDVVVKLVLVFFIALLSFSIGTFVGKKFSDNQYKLSQLEPNGELPQRDVASVHPDAGEVKPSEMITDEEVAKLADEFITDDEKPPTKEAGHSEDSHTTDKADVPATHTEAKADGKAPEHGTEQHAAKEVAKAEHSHESAKNDKSVKAEKPLKAADRVAEGHSPSPVVAAKERPKSRIPSSLPKEVAASTIGKFTVQIASYAEEKEAQKMAAELKEKGYSAFYVPAAVKGKTWFRVSVGLFATQKEASNYKTELQSKAKLGTPIVQKITAE